MLSSLKRFFTEDRGCANFDDFEEVKRTYSKNDFGDTCSLTADRPGFAITFEIMLTMILVVNFALATVFFTSIYQVQRYYADVASATCALAARYGGNDSNAYKVQVKDGGTIQGNAQKQLDAIDSRSLFEPHIYVSERQGETAVTHSNGREGYVQVVLEYKLKEGSAGSVWDMLDHFGLKNQRQIQVFEVPSLVRKGYLV